MDWANSGESCVDKALRLAGYQTEDLNLCFIAAVGCITLMSKQSSSINKSMNSSDPRGRSPHFPSFLCLCSPLWLRDPWSLPICKKSEIIFFFFFFRRQCEPGCRNFQGRGLTTPESLKHLVRVLCLCYILTATVGRNLFCLDHCDTVSSSHKSKLGQELDKEWNIWTNVCPATS